MKVELKKTKKETNFKGPVKKIGIQNVGIVSDLLRKHYAHPIRTLVQEYLSNARDAHREVKNTSDKIVVVLPTKISPILKIRDYGPGLSPKRINDVFCYLGNSTKRKTNNQTGGFGIGSKSAFAYRENFFVKSFYNGTETLYECSTAHHYEGTIEELSKKQTSEKNGVEIQIPVLVTDIESFISSVYRATFFWTDKEKPLIKGFFNYDFCSEYLNIDNLKIYKYNNIGLSKLFPNKTILFVLDGIPYEIKNSKSRAFERSKYLTTLHFPTGIFKVSISRENIEENTESIKKINQELSLIKAKVSKFSKNKFYENKTIEQKVKFLNNFENIFNISYSFPVSELIFVGANPWFVKTNDSSRISFINENNHPVEAVNLQSLINKKLYLKDDECVTSEKKQKYEFRVFLKLNNKCSSEVSNYINSLKLKKTSQLEDKPVEVKYRAIINNSTFVLSKTSLLESSKTCLILLTDRQSNLYSVNNSSNLGKVKEILNNEICKRIHEYSGYTIILIDKKHEQEIQEVYQKNSNLKTINNVLELFTYCNISNELAQLLILKEKISISNVSEKTMILNSIKNVNLQFYNKNLKDIKNKIQKIHYAGTVSKTVLQFIKKYYKFNNKKSEDLVNNIAKFDQFVVKIKNNNLDIYCLLKSFSDIKKDKNLTEKDVKKIQMQINKVINKLF
jgi:hypothetical protein